MYRAVDLNTHCHGHLWGVWHTLLHRYTKNGSLGVGGFNRESIFWSVSVGAYCIRPETYRVFDSMDYVYSKNGWQIDSFVPWRGRLWGVCNTPLHGCTKNGSLWVGCFNGEPNFWSVRVGAYCIRPKTYRVDDSIDRGESNFYRV